MMQSHFRDELVLQIIRQFGGRTLSTDAIPDANESTIFISHCSIPRREHAMCAWCQTGKTKGGNVVTVNYTPHFARQLRRTVMLSGTCMPSGDEWRSQWQKQKRHTSSEANHQPEDPVSS